MRSKLVEFQEENNSLRSKITSLEVASYGATEQERLIGNSPFLLLYCFSYVHVQGTVYQSVTCSLTHTLTYLLT